MKNRFEIKLKTIMSRQDLKRVYISAAVSIITAIVLSAGSFIANHFHNKYTLKDHGKRIEVVEDMVSRKAEIKDVEALYQKAEEIATIKENSVLKDIDELNNKVDAIYELLYDFKNNKNGN